MLVSREWLRKKIEAEPEADVEAGPPIEVLDDIGMFLSTDVVAASDAKSELKEALPQLLIKARIRKGLTPKDLAKALGLKEQQIRRYEADEYRGASVKRLREIAAALGIDIKETSSLHAPTDPTFAWADFPVREMNKRKWFNDFNGTTAQAVARADVLVPTFLRSGNLLQPVAMLNKQNVRKGSASNPLALLAWQARVSFCASQETIPAYRHGSITSNWVKELVSLSAKQDGPACVKPYLNSLGIHFFVEEHLPQTHLDGAVFVSAEGQPIIGMTIRHDRLDNFWFVLLHEVGHVVQHYDLLKAAPIFDEDIEGEDKDLIEDQADEYAQEALIPSSYWNEALSRFFPSDDTIVADAAALKIAPAIIAGRIRREQMKYTIYTKLIGQGEVRKLFNRG